MSTAAPQTSFFDPAEVLRGLEFLLPAGQVAEVRILDAKVNGDRFAATYSGFFNDPQKLVESLSPIKSALGAYITINPVNDALIARACNRLKRAGKGDSTSDKDIVQRRWLFIDCDAVRPAGISATDEERKASLDVSRAIANDLRYNYGWSEPVIVDSGNGYHLDYPIDLPADDGGLVERCLKALDAKFSNTKAKVDTSCFNPARITKLPGTTACKGDSITDRPHRPSRVVKAPATLHAITKTQLEELASESPTSEPNSNHKHTSNGDAFDIDGFIARNGFDLSGPDPYQGGRKWTFDRSPLCDHHGDGPYLIQFASGALSAGCHHDSCKGKWGWAELRAAFEPKRERANSSAHSTPHHEPTKQSIEVVQFGELYVRHPRLNKPVFDGLLREGETCNLISNPKRGKSWTAYGMALSVVCEIPWLGQFNTSGGKVLIVDNELHPQTLANRVPYVANAMGILPADYATDLHIISLRGNLQSLFELEERFERIAPGTYKLIILDAMYRFCIDGVSENDNSAMAGFYNRLDRIAALTRAAIVVIHHASKGSQSEKRVTDVGSGAGAQSRAADCHLILREHEEDDVVVLEAAVRSFPPVRALPLRWSFPVWVPDSYVDPGKLRGNQTRNEERQKDRDREATNKIVDALRKDGPATARQLRQRTGLSRERQQRLLDYLASEGQLIVTETNIQGNKTNEYALPKSAY